MAGANGSIYEHMHATLWTIQKCIPVVGTCRVL